MEFPASFQERVARADEPREDGPQENLFETLYLHPSKIDTKKPAHIALVWDDVFVCWEMFGIEKDSGKAKPIRFSEKPSESTVLAALGDNYEWGSDYNDKNKRSDVKELHLYCVYDFDKKIIRNLIVKQFTVQKALFRIISNPKLQPITDWDLRIQRSVQDIKDKNGIARQKTTYEVFSEPRDQETEADIKREWKKYQTIHDPQRYILGGHPLSPES